MYSDEGRRAFVRGMGAALTIAFVLPVRAFAMADKDEEDEPQGAVYEPGGDVRPPKLVHYVEPDFSPSSKEAFVEGVVRISTVVKTDGKPVQLKVVKGLSAEEDRLAANAVTQWRFQPGTRSGQPVNVRVLVEVAFHLL